MVFSRIYRAEKHEIWLGSAPSPAVLIVCGLCVACVWLVCGLSLCGVFVCVWLVCGSCVMCWYVYGLCVVSLVLCVRFSAHLP